MEEAESKLRQRTGGRLDRTRDPAILDAALACLAENGYDATNMHDVAERAGVGKAAIYRRWSSKAALMADALVYWRPDRLDNGAPDTGSLRGDFDEVIERMKRNDETLVSTNLILRVAVESAKDAELASALDQLMPLRGRRVISAILHQAEARGEIAPDRDRSLVADVATAMSLLQVIRGQRVDAAFVRQVIDMLVMPAVER